MIFQRLHLCKIFLKELAEDVGVKASHDLTSWADQGSSLLNACLTVPAGQANGHAGVIWEEFTDAVIRLVSQEEEHVVSLFSGGLCSEEESFD